MKRKFLMIILALTAVLACVFAFTACNKNDEEEGNNKPGTENPDTEKPDEEEEEHVHSYGDWVVITEPTCTEAGERRKSCNCGVFITEELDPLGHDIVHHEAKEFSCEEDGWEAYDECQREGCGYTTKEVITAHHVYEDHFCVNCGRYQADIELSEDSKAYVITSIGDLTETDIVIPSEINGIPVVGIDESAFRYTNITSIELPDTLTYIGPEAFDHCLELTTVILPDDIISVGAGAFTGCEKFEYNKKDNGNYLGSKTNPYLLLMNVDKNVETVSIGADTKIIYYQAFSGCENLKSVVIPDTVIELGVEAFMDCSALESVILPATGNIELDGTFMNCVSLKSLELPSSVTKIGPISFSGCSNLEELIIPTSVTIIDYGAFYFCSSLKEITIPESVTVLESNAFGYCENLEKVYILANISEIIYDAFTECPKLCEIVLPASLTIINSGAFLDFSQNELQEKVYFLGTKAEWEAVTVEGYNTHIENATVYFYSETAPLSGNYWHWVDDKPVIWTTVN